VKAYNQSLISQRYVQSGGLIRRRTKDF